MASTAAEVGVALFAQFPDGRSSAQSRLRGLSTQDHADVGAA